MRIYSIRYIQGWFGSARAAYLSSTVLSTCGLPWHELSSRHVLSCDVSKSLQFEVAHSHGELEPCRRKHGDAIDRCGARFRPVVPGGRRELGHGVVPHWALTDTLRPLRTGLSLDIGAAFLQSDFVSKQVRCFIGLAKSQSPSPRRTTRTGATQPGDRPLQSYPLAARSSLCHVPDKQSRVR